MSLNLVSEHLLAANGLSHQDLFSILGQLTERRLDYGDLYFQSSYHESWVLEDSIIKDGSYNIDQGVGVRAVSGEKTGFAYADQISLNALEQSAQAARTIVRETGFQRSAVARRLATGRSRTSSAGLRACTRSTTSGSPRHSSQRPLCGSCSWAGDSFGRRTGCQSRSASSAEAVLCALP